MRNCFGLCLPPNGFRSVGLLDTDLQCNYVLGLIFLGGILSVMECITYTYYQLRGSNADYFKPFQKSIRRRFRHQLQVVLSLHHVVVESLLLPYRRSCSYSSACASFTDVSSCFLLRSTASAVSNASNASFSLSVIT